MVIQEEPETEAGGTTPIHTLVMLYEEAIRSMGRAAIAIEEGDVKARCRHVERAVTIVADLYGGLDMEQGGEIAVQLATAYRLVLARLVLVNGRNDADLARAAAGLLKPILDAWRVIELEMADTWCSPVALSVAASDDAATTARVDRPAA